MVLGIDRGSVYTKALLFEGGRVVQKWTLGGLELRESLIKIFEGVKSIGVNQLQVNTVNFSLPFGRKVEQFNALKKGVLYLHPSTRTIIEIGGERARFMKISPRGETEDFSLTERCASGTGLFIEQQASRLHLSLEEFCELALKAEKPAKVAARCAVFAKSDMIHLQQKGIPVGEIAYGLCFSVATNIFSSLLKGREIVSPVVIAGGVSKNLPVMRALRLLIESEEVFQSSMPGYECALGASLLAGGEEIGVDDAIKLIREEKPGRSPAHTSALRELDTSIRSEPDVLYAEEKEAFIGIDVGSVSTNIVAVDPEGRVLSAVYLPTRGRPQEVVVEGLEIIRSRFQGGLKVLGCCTTGSGRYLAQAITGADIVKNEITCQMKGTLFYFPEADTIFEIGGQDSKYIYMENGHLKDFTMNKVCAAGTGSFIEEQTAIMGIDVKTDFSKLALSSERPLFLASHCTVFMERAVSKALSEGASKEDICAGIAYAIARNYLERVVEKRKIGDFIVFQGGVAANKAVHSAFENLTGKKIHVHPFSRISGAIGAALIARENLRGKSSFRFPEKVPGRMKTFECRHCSNFCDVSVIRLGEKGFAFFGDTCERYTSGRKSCEFKGWDLTGEYIREAERYVDGENPQGAPVIGIPRASFIISQIPFWATFFKRLGYRVILSSPSSRDVLLRSSKLLQTVTCLPVKFVAGHVDELLERADFVFLPYLYAYGEGEYTCPYTQALPSMMKVPRERVIAPALSMEEEEFLRAFRRFSHLKGFTPDRIRRAYRQALKVQSEFEARMRERAISLMNGSDKVVLVIGRPYNIYDPYLNLNLFSHLRKLGFTAIPMNLFPAEDGGDGFFPWKHSSDGLKLLKKVVKENRVYPIILSNYGCGPDAFAHKVFEEVVRDYPALFLEFDEHRGEAGLITRLEAFDDLLKGENNYKTTHTVNIPRRLSMPGEQLRGRVVYIPYFADHAYAFSGALRFAGIDARVLPPPDEKIAQKGERESSGKECHAYSYLLGDLVNLIQAGKDNFVFLFPGTRIPCLLNQYETGMKIYLKNSGVNSVKVFTPFAPEFIAIVGMKGAEHFYRALFAIDSMHKILSFVRPFELEKGRALEVYREFLKEVEEGTAEGKVLEVFEKYDQKMMDVPVRVDDRPVVGVAGDIYTRVNRSANFDLYGVLADKGLVAVPSPFQIDIVDFGLEKDFYYSFKNADFKKFFLNGLILLRRFFEIRKFYRIAGKVLREFEEPSFLRIRKYAERYTENINNELFYLNVAKMVHFAEKGLQGIINAICFNCMVGTSSSAVAQKIKQDYNIPVVTLVYSGEKDADTEALLEAFVEEVNERYEEGKRSGKRYFVATAISMR